MFGDACVLSTIDVGSWREPILAERVLWGNQFVNPGIEDPQFPFTFF